MPSSSLAQDADEAVWAMTYDKIAAYLRGRDSRFEDRYLVQLPTVPVFANWTDKAQLFSFYSVADGRPVWGPTWAPTTALFSEAYQEFVDAIQLPQVSPASAQLERDYTHASDNYANELDRQRSNWLQFDQRQRKNDKSGKTWLTRSAWYSTYANSRLLVLRNAKNAALSNYVSSLPATYRTHARWIEAAHNDAAMIDVRMPSTAEDMNADSADATSWRVDTRYPYVFNVQDLKTLRDEGEAAALANKWTEWTFSSSAVSSDKHKKSWGGRGSYGKFFRARVGVSKTEESVTTAEAATKIVFGFRAIAQVPLNPANTWYKRSLINAYACGPFKPSVDANKNWFGADGALSVVPSSVVLAFRPKVHAELSKSQYELYEKTLSANGGFSVGPFAVGGRYGDFRRKESKVGNGGTVDSEGIGSTIVVIAVLYEKLGVECSKTRPTNAAATLR